MKRLVLNLLRARMMKGMSTKKAVTEEVAILYVFQFARVLCFESGDGLFLLMLLGLSVYAM